MTLKYVHNGRYQIVNRLGAGSYGAVYRARERLPNSNVFVPRAIKIIPLARVKKTNLHVREISLHKRIPKHPNVVTMHRAFEENRLVFIVMDLLDGGDLHAHIALNHTFSRNDALIKNVFLQIIDGVDAAHRAGVFHRDLKPDNIFLNADFTQVCIGDFGLATATRHSTSFNTGSRLYMSPECVDCDDELYPYDTRRSDIWALGVILFNLVTGHMPWRKATLEDGQFEHFLEDHEYLRTIFPISKGLNDVLRNIFTIIPSEALSLAEIRREIRNLDSFYMSPAELRTAPDDVKYMWHWYAPHTSQYDSQESSDSEGGLDSWTSSESTEESLEGQSSNDSESDASQVDIDPTATHMLDTAEEGRVALPRSLGASQPRRSSPPACPQIRTMSSDEFPIRHPATRRAQVPPPLSSDDSESGSSDEPPVTPETYAQNSADVVVDGPIEPLVLEPKTVVLSIEKTSPKKAAPGIIETLTNLWRPFVSSATS
ncbi:kinase-like domain-containing protein [Trametes meyenii]|nr:kinase-like domain-containing protein [Trametes meyenii]